MENRCRYCGEGIAEPSGRRRPRPHPRARDRGQLSLGVREQLPATLVPGQPVDDDLFCPLPRACRYAFVGKVAAVKALDNQHRDGGQQGQSLGVQGAFF